MSIFEDMDFEEEPEPTREEILASLWEKATHTSATIQITAGNFGLIKVLDGEGDQIISFHVSTSDETFYEAARAYIAGVLCGRIEGRIELQSQLRQLIGQ